MEARKMSLLVIKLFFAKAWVWLRNHWKITALAVYTIVLYFVFRKGYNNAKNILDAQRQSHKEEIDALNTTHAEANRKKDENLRKYQELMEKIEKKHEEDKKELTEKKRKRVKEIVDEAGDDPQKLAELVRDSFGFEIAEDENE
jgi:uncharacterized membrane protein YhiD involved in acid resistance